MLLGMHQHASTSNMAGCIISDYVVSTYTVNCWYSLDPPALCIRCILNEPALCALLHHAYWDIACRQLLRTSPAVCQQLFLLAAVASKEVADAATEVVMEYDMRQEVAKLQTLVGQLAVAKEHLKVCNHIPQVPHGVQILSASHVVPWLHSTTIAWPTSIAVNVTPCSAVGVRCFNCTHISIFTPVQKD